MNILTYQLHTLYFTIPLMLGGTSLSGPKQLECVKMIGRTYVWEYRVFRFQRNFGPCSCSVSHWKRSRVDAVRTFDADDSKHLRGGKHKLEAFDTVDVVIVVVAVVVEDGGSLANCSTRTDLLIEYPRRDRAASTTDSCSAMVCSFTIAHTAPTTTWYNYTFILCAGHKTHGAWIHLVTSNSGGVVACIFSLSPG